MSGDLRIRAEAILRANPQQTPMIPTADVQSVIHELRVHQIELEMQTEELRQAQIRISKTRDAYAELYDLAPVGYLTLDRAGRITNANLATCKLLGVAPGSLARQRFADFVRPESQDDWYRHRRALLPDGERQVVDLAMRHAEGTPLLVHLESRAIPASPGEPWRCLIALIDITQRRQTEMELDHKRELFERIFDNIPVLLVLWDPQLSRFTLNRHTQEVLGWTTEDANQGDFLTKVYPDAADRSKVLRFMRRLDGGWREWTATSKDGRRIPTEWTNLRLTDRTMIGIGLDLRQRKESERALRDQEEDLRAALRAAHMFAFEWDPHSDVVIRSASVGQLLGADADDPRRILGRQHFDHLPDEDRTRLLEQIANLRPDKPEYHLEYRYQRPDGEVLWIEENARAEFNQRGEIVRLRGVSADVTELVKSREERRLAAAASAAAQASVDTVNAMGEGVALLDPRGRVRKANPAFLRLTDKRADEIEGTDVRELLPEVFEVQSSEIRSTLARVVLKETTSDLDDALPIVTRAGDHKWVVPAVSSLYGSAGEVVGIVLTLRDTTALMRAHHGLRQSEEAYRRLVDNVHNLIVRLNAAGEVLFINDFAHRFLGYEPAELIQRGVFTDVLTQPPPESSLPPHAADGFAASRLKSTETEFVCADGRRVWVHWTLRELFDDQGVLQEIFCVGTDVTDRKRLEQASTKYRRRLQGLTERLTVTEEKLRRQLAGQIHDTVIQTLSFAAMRLAGLRASLEKAGVSRLCHDLDGTRSLLTESIAGCRGLMAEIVPPFLYELGLGAALHEFAARQQQAHGRTIRCHDDQPEEPLDDARRGLLFQCARELVFNALKHAGPCEIDIRLRHQADSTCLEVVDTGRGFEVAGLEGGSQREGGFGLFNLRERLWGARGDLQIRSRPGEGTRVLVRLPRSAQP